VTPYEGPPPSMRRVVRLASVRRVATSLVSGRGMQGGGGITYDAGWACANDYGIPLCSRPICGHAGEEGEKVNDKE
jgi:hypothetical protein